MGLAKILNASLGTVLAIGVIASSRGAVSAENPDAVFTALSARHMTVTRESLESAAGGEDALVRKLIELRSDTRLPYVSIRAEKFLLEYASRSDVRQVLVEDMESADRKGLAKTVALHLNRVPDAEAKRDLASRLVNRAQRESEFTPFARELVKSDDPEIQRLGRQVK